MADFSTPFFNALQMGFNLSDKARERKLEKDKLALKKEQDKLDAQYKFMDKYGSLLPIETQQIFYQSLGKNSGVDTSVDPNALIAYSQKTTGAAPSEEDMIQMFTYVGVPQTKALQLANQLKNKPKYMYDDVLAIEKNKINQEFELNKARISKESKDKSDPIKDQTEAWKLATSGLSNYFKLVKDGATEEQAQIQLATAENNARVSLDEEEIKILDTIINPILEGTGITGKKKGTITTFDGKEIRTIDDIMKIAGATDAKSRRKLMTATQILYKKKELDGTLGLGVAKKPSTGLLKNEQGKYDRTKIAELLLNPSITVSKELIAKRKNK